MDVSTTCLIFYEGDDHQPNARNGFNQNMIAQKTAGCQDSLGRKRNMGIKYQTFTFQFMNKLLGMTYPYLEISP